MEHLPTHRSILVFDVEGFSEPYRDDRARTAVRAALYGVLREAFQAAGLAWPPEGHEDRGDGVIVLVSPLVPKVLLIDPLLDCLCAALAEHNRNARLAERFRLRCAVHAGEVSNDPYGMSGIDLILACRMLDAAELRTALRNCPVDVATSFSDAFYEAAVRHGYRDIDPATYHPVLVQVKKNRIHAWIHLPGTAAPPVLTPAASGHPAPRRRRV
ncbi:hypothetical protein [Actinophytocola sp.]|uniref:hypothetical protein n=1 Tax=Actinophytocola sp. TaxID=1872138 RepID=UPI00389AC08C